MIGQLLTIARNTFVESIRQPIYFILIILSGIFQILLTWMTAFSMGQTQTSEVSADNKFLLDLGMGNIFVFGTLLAAFIATAVVSREIERKTILTVVSKPTPRPVVIIGKYLGVAAAILIAVALMTLFLLMSIRHGVMSTAADRLDGPVLLFSFSAVFLAVFLGTAANYLYGWPFSQTTVLVMLPAMILAYVGVLFIAKDWSIQPLYEVQYFYRYQWRTLEEFVNRFGDKPEVIFACPSRISFPTLKPQITMACASLSLAILVLTSVAVAASTRFGQVMTIVICAGVFLAGLLANSLIGRYAFKNDMVGIINLAEPTHPGFTPLSSDGDTYRIQLENLPTRLVRPGESSFYWGPIPTGARLNSPGYPRDLVNPSGRTPQTPGVVVVTAEGTDLTIRNVGGVAVSRPPVKGDYAFIEPTDVNTLATAAWLVIPNLHHYWLLDAVSTNVPIPPRHLAMVAGYALTQIAFFLAAGVILFQKRDVG